MPFWRKSEKSDARRDAKAHFLLVKGNTEKSIFTKKCWGEKKSVFRHHWPFYPIRLRDFLHIQYWIFELHPPYPSLGGWLWAPMQILWKMLKTRGILILKKSIFSKIDEKWIWTKFYIQFFAQNSNPDPKLDQKPPKTRFLKNFDFYVFYKFYIKMPFFIGRRHRPEAL